MPEYKEYHTDGVQITYFVESTSPEDRVLQHILGDTTGKEIEHHLPGSRAAAGHVYEFDSSSTVKRGGAVKEDKKTPVFPEKYATEPGKPPVPISSYGLCLVQVKTGPRAIILEFKEDKGKGTSYWCQIQLFTHTNAQIFTLDEWTNGICKVDRKTRGFKVGFAFQFEKYVLAFLSLDLLVQIYWSDVPEHLPHLPADIVTEYPRFIEELVAWIQKRRATKSRREGIALNLIHSETEIFCGAGVYTIQEVFHRAGLSPNLTEHEIFDNPSRTARLVAAFYEFCLNARQRTWPFIRPFLHGFLRACRREDRALYSNELLVYGKDRANHSTRFKDLLKMFNSCLESHALSADRWTRVHGAPGVPYDVFEPDLIHHALEHKDLQLGSLIFSDERWCKLASESGVADAGQLDPLSEYFSSPEFSHSHSNTWLHPRYYDYLFNPPLSRQGMTAWSHTKLYRWSNTNVWSVIPIYPALSVAADPALSSVECRKGKTTMKKGKPKKSSTQGTRARVKIEVLDDEVRAGLLLKNVTQHSEVYTVGPLDFCGIAQIITGPGGTDMVMVCKMDPRRTSFCVERHILGSAMAKLKGKGLEKKGLDLKVKASLLKKIPKRKREEIDDNDSIKENSSVLSSPSSSLITLPPTSSPVPSSPVRPPKRKRRSADRDILAQANQVLSDVGNF
ncbi:hypothetical protein CPB84DRAFT_1769209 [Gymnopilus junonius]|uniref:Uncharacterized protein n=1 Tax=Gymnopilus junonius TaxID=109634 RepID=A0A9P5TQN1_GYMJU|nr:hypothetical protein CPB84DRAFT_1769209 [Gymnopilus junonius]